MYVQGQLPSDLELTDSFESAPEQRRDLKNGLNSPRPHVEGMRRKCNLYDCLLVRLLAELPGCGPGCPALLPRASCGAA